jgi:chromosome segregation ATPase
MDFEKTNASIAVFGENAAGKSSITDAIEWFFNDRIDHLWKEDCKEEALRNVHLADSEDASVSIEFSNSALTCAKSLDRNLRSKETNSSSAFKDYKAKSGGERIILRTTDLSQLADESKGDKRKRIQKLLATMLL